MLLVLMDAPSRDIVKSNQYKHLNENTMKLFFGIELTTWVANPNPLNNIKFEPHACSDTCGVAIPERQTNLLS